MIALGSPNGFENTASIGYLTGLNRDMEMEFIYEKIYQIDAQIDHGSSGGPLLDATTGKVIGINSLLYKDNTVFGFSIPMHSMQKIVDQWIQQPMNSKEVAALFDVYDDLEYYNFEDESEDYTYYNDYEYYTTDEEEYVEEDDSYNEDLYDEITGFYQSFRDQYEAALANEDYDFIEPFILSGSQAELEFSSYMDKIAGTGVSFEFQENEASDVRIQPDDSISVYTYETFYFTDENGETEFNERYKIYTFVVDSDGEYHMTNVAKQ